MTFANPAGAWALLGLAAVLAIHLLQRRRTRVVATTLFMVEPSAVEGLEGRRPEPLRRSRSLWLQLLAVLAATWLLLEPRTTVAESRVRVVMVLDASASMGAFRDRAKSAARARMDTVSATRVDWVVMESAVRRPTLYSGPDAGQARAALEGWQPRLASHDPAPALLAARSTAGEGGRVIFVTDHETAAALGVERLAVGAPTDNVGFVGVDVENGEWHALVRNHGRVSTTRALRAEGGEIAATRFTLQPGEIRAVTGAFPAGTDRLVLVLDADALPLDDRLPLVRPQPKRLRIGVDAAAQRMPFVARFLASLEATSPAELTSAAVPSDLAIVRDPAMARGAAIVLMPSAPGPPQAVQAVVAAPHSLTADLGWSSLLVGDRAAAHPLPSDTVLLSAAGRPLVLLRQTPPRFVVAFDIERSNAVRAPAFVLMLHRFVAAVRTELPGREQANVETGQPLAVATQGAVRLQHPDGSTAMVDASTLRAPDIPGFFRVSQGSDERFVGAAHFADSAEADLTRAASQADPPPATVAASSTRTREAPWTPLVVLLLGGLVVADGMVGARRA